MLIDLTCPAEVFQAELPTEEIPAVSLALYNLSDRVIVSAEVTLRLLGGSGAEKERVVYRARALNGRPHSTFRMNVPCTAHAGARSADVTVDKVWFNDNEVWRREQSASVEYTPNALPVSKALMDLKFAAGETAVGFPSQQDGLWVCVCGRPNPDGETVCVRCRRPKELVFARFTREAVEKQISQRERQLDLNTRSAREDTARLQRLREEEFNRAQERRKRRRHLAWSLPLLAVIAALLLGVAEPVLRVVSVNLAMEQGNWEGASRILERMGDFPGAKEKMRECAWQLARQQAERAETPEEMEAAADALRAVEGHPESVALAEETDLKRARAALDAKDPEAARAAVERLPEDDGRRKALENECLFQEAKEQMARGEYEDARQAFLLLKDDFPEAAGLAAECVYFPASALIDEGEYDRAIEEMSRIPEHPQSRMAIQECHYKKAQEAEALGDKEIAASEYLMAGEYGDAPEKTRELVLLLAGEAYEAGDYELARQLSASLPGYEPAQELEKASTLGMARDALKSKEYELAAELLATLPGGYEDRDELLPEACYRAGVDAAKRKEWEKAVSYLDRAGDYRDAASRLEKAAENRVKELLAAGDAQGALALLPRISGSKKYRDYQQEAEYLDAVAQLENGGDPEEARERFEALGNYKDAPKRVKQTYYLQAGQAAARGETLTAGRLYARASGWEDADAKAEAQFDLYYGERAAAAREAADSGDYPLAVTVLETLDRAELPEKYADLGTLYETACLKAGEQLFQAGRPYEAAAFFRRVGDARKTRRWLDQACYRILGTWTDGNGQVVARFREDSTCEIAGESFTFLVSDSYTLKTEADGEMKATFRITDLDENRLSLRDLREGRNVSYNLRRGEEASPPPAEESPAGDGAAEGDGGSFVVGDGE